MESTPTSLWIRRFSKLSSKIGSLFKCEALRPFGIVITPMSKKNMTFISPSQIDQIAKDEKLVVLRGFDQINRETFLEYCHSFPNRETLEWDFGPVMEMKETPGAKNYLFSREKVPFHWDGA